MNRPRFYFFLLISAYMCIFILPSFWLFLPALYVFIVLSHTLSKSLFWLSAFNMLVLFWLLFLVLGGEWSEAFRIFWTSNLFMIFALGLYCNRGAIFITQSLQNIFPKKLNLLIFMSAKLIDDLKTDLEKSKKTLKIRLPNSASFLLTCKAYGYLIGKLICHGLLRSQKLLVVLKIRGYEGEKLGVFEEKSIYKDYFAFILLLLSAILGGAF